MQEKTIYGFKKLQEREVTELDAILDEYIHERSGLKLYFLRRDDENKTFAIAFKTIPSDSTGVFHILEHSVLSGSEKYPLKEPFLNLLKGSMNTFLNAMTYPDKTVYPVSSKNDKDFINLTKVYLDAVFKPLIYQNESIFRQEGWHYSFDGDDISYKGVVYNEMKGAMSDSDEIAIDALSKALFKDSSYAFNSGGDPSAITDLSYEAFLKAHEIFYSPSNAYVVVDGNADIGSIMQLLDKEYLQDQTQIEIATDRLYQEPYIAKRTRVAYDATSEDDPISLIYGYVIGRYDEMVKILGVNVLEDVLCGYLEAPLKKAIIDSGLAKDISITIIDSVAEPWLKVEIKDIKEEAVSSLDDLYISTLKRLSEEGLDKEQIKASLASLEFSMKERDFGTLPLGCVLAISILESVIYGGDPLLKVEIDSYFKELKTKIDDDYLERLIEEVFISNKHQASIVLYPDIRLQERKAQEEREKIKNIEASFSDEDKKRYMKIEEDLKVWQNSDDTKEAKASLPHLELADIDSEPRRLESDIRELDGIKIIEHYEATNGIKYVNLYFDIDGLDEESYQDLQLLTTLFGKLDTRKHDSSELARLISLTFGSSSMQILSNEDLKKGLVHHKLVVSFSALDENIAMAQKLILEIIEETVVDETSIKDIKKLIDQMYIMKSQSLASNAQSLARYRVMAKFSTSGVVQDLTRGLSYHRYLKDLAKMSDLRGLVDRLKRLRKCFTKDGLIISITSKEPRESDVALIIEGLKDEKIDRTSKIALYPNVNEAIILPCDVSSLVYAVDINDVHTYRGSDSVAMKILSMEYLWGEVRRKGGAYGTNAAISMQGIMSLSSYRDPSPSKTLSIFKESPKALEDLGKDGDIKTNIIGTISDAEPVMSARLKGILADSRIIAHIEHAKIVQNRKEVLATDSSDIARFASDLKEVIEEATYCVAGNKEAIEKMTDVEIVWEI